MQSSLTHQAQGVCVCVFVSASIGRPVLECANNFKVQVAKWDKSYTGLLCLNYLNELMLVFSLVLHTVRT